MIHKLCLVSCIFFLFSFSSAQQTDTLYILQTTDVHGNVRDYDYFNDKPSDYGLARIYTKVAEYQKRHKNVILVDGGDLIQGTPMIYYFNHLKKDVPNPMILTMNYMGYDAFAVGNHDIEQGPAVYDRAEEESKFPWLSANSVLENGRTYFKPYTIIERNGIRIGIIGLTTPAIPMWLNKSLYPGIKWGDMVETAKKYVKIVRPQVDVLVGLFHAGFEAGYSVRQTEALGLPNENASRLVAEQVPGFDIVFAGHSHRVLPEPKQQKATGQRPLLINAGSWGRNLGVAEVIVTSSKYQDAKKEKSQFPIAKAEEKAEWKIIEMNGRLESMKEVTASSAILQLTEDYHNKTLDYIRTPVAELTQPMNSANSRFEDNAVVELINKAQLDYTGADISFAASFNDRLSIPAGQIRIKDIYGMYRYENFLYTLEMTGRQIKDFLEYSARFFICKNGKIMANPETPGYNYDMAEGVSYKIKVASKKYQDEKQKTQKTRRKKQDKKLKTENRIQKSELRNTVEGLVFIKTGQPLEMDKVYIVAMNSYRATGGGGHLAAAGITKPIILSKSNMEMRTILTEYIKKQKIIQPATDGNWQLVLDQ